MYHLPKLKRVKLFDEPVYYVNQDLYANFYDEITNDKPISSYPELEKYRENIKLLLNYDPRFKRWMVNDRTTWDVYIEQVVSLCIELGDIAINKNIFKFIEVSHAYTTDEKILSIIRTLYLPDKLDDLEQYLMDCLIIYNSISWGIIDNKEIREFTDYLKGLLKYFYKPTLTVNCETISLLFAYIRYHKLDDYELITRFLNNKDSFTEKMKMNDCFVRDEARYGRTYDSYSCFDSERAAILFNNLDSFFDQKDGLIK